MTATRMDLRVLWLVLASLALWSPRSALAESRHEGAFLIFSRKMSGDLVQGINVTIRYEIHNVGEADATSIRLRDTAFPASRFTVHSGTFRSSWSRINAGQSVVANVQAQPKHAGELIVNPAALSYQDGGAARTIRLAGSKVIEVEDILSYRRRTDKHQTAWLVYACAALVAIGAPFLRYSVAISKVPDAVAPVKKRT